MRGATGSQTPTILIVNRLQRPANFRRRFDARLLKERVDFWRRNNIERPLPFQFKFFDQQQILLGRD
jgi:hypothetical protein